MINRTESRSSHPEKAALYRDVSRVDNAVGCALPGCKTTEDVKIFYGYPVSVAVVCDWLFRGRHIGVGTSGEISRGGFVLSSGTNNVIIRNLTIGDTYKEDDPNGKNNDWDGIQMDTSHHIWIDHCDFHHGGDGLIDSRKGTTNLTVSWTIIRNHNKAFGIGWVAKGDVKTEMTIHHNWVHDTIQRNPSTDEVLRAHLYNNYLQDIKLYGTWARGGTHMVLEHCVFDNVSNPFFFNSTGVDITSHGFDSEDDHSGELINIGNIVRDNCTGKTESTGTTYKFFDPHDSYPYKLDPAEGLETLLAKCAGPRPELGLK